MNSFKTILCLATVLYVDSASAQNIVEQNFLGLTANPVTLTDTEVSESTGPAPKFGSTQSTVQNWTRRPNAARVARKLEAHIQQFLAGAPWMPFQQTLGISGFETAFAHPDGTFYALSIAIPFLRDGTATQACAFLRAELATHPPFAEDGYDLNQNRPRESHAIPAQQRRAGRGRADSIFGVYALWAYGHYAGGSNELARLWPEVRSRVEPLLKNEYRFEPRPRSGPSSESEQLNGNIAGLIGFIRLARSLGDAASEERARRRVRQLLELRLNLERLNPNLLEPSRAATRSLHNYRLARYGHLVPELAAIIARKTDDCGAKNLETFRRQRNAWHLAYGDRLIGGENYTNPIHFPWAMFTGAALIEKLPATELFSFIDVPWCRGDLFFVEKCALTLWADTGSPWDETRP